MNMRSLMDAAILNQPLDIEVKKVEVPEPKEDEALIKVHCIGVCGSDVHYYEHGKIGRYVVEEPIILGHELAGEVVKVGKHVDRKSTRLNSSHVAISYAVFCLKKKKHNNHVNHIK